jgi:hypothetical protein
MTSPFLIDPPLTLVARHVRVTGAGETVIEDAGTLVRLSVSLAPIVVAPGSAVIDAHTRKPFAQITASSTIPVTGTPLTTGLNNAAMIFYAAEISAFQAGTPTFTITFGHGTRPHGTLEQMSEGGASASVVERASDAGYRTWAGDGDPVVYPPFLTNEFQIDRRFNLPPAQPAIAAAWGTLSLSNTNNQFSTLVRDWNNSGRPLTILYGTKTLESFSGTRTSAGHTYSARGLFLDPAYATLVPVFKGVQAPWVLSEDSLDVPLRDASWWLDRPYQPNQYQGTGTYQGTADMKGMPIPRTRGGFSGYPVRNVTPVLVDPVHLIYQYNDGTGTVANLYEGGALTITAQGNVSDLYTGSTTAGMYRTDNLRGLFQLGSTPAAAITADVTGAFPGFGTISNVVSIAEVLLSEDLGMPSAYIDSANFATVTGSYALIGGVHFDSTSARTGFDAMAMVLAGVGAKLYPGRDGKLRLMVLRAPSGSPVFTFDRSNTISLVPRQLDAAIDPPPYRIRVGYNHNYTVQTSGLLGSATAAQRAFVATADSFAASVSATIQTNYLRPNDMDPLITALLVPSDAQRIADELLALWAVRRRLYVVTVPVSLGLPRDLGEVVRLIWPVDNLAIGQIGIIVGETFNSLDSTIALSVLV